jgi:hypothetical protein
MYRNDHDAALARIADLEAELVHKERRCEALARENAELRKPSKPTSRQASRNQLERIARSWSLVEWLAITVLFGGLCIVTGEVVALAPLPLFALAAFGPRASCPGCDRRIDAEAARTILATQRCPWCRHEFGGEPWNLLGK